MRSLTVTKTRKRRVKLLIYNVECKSRIYRDVRALRYQNINQVCWSANENRKCSGGFVRSTYTKHSRECPWCDWNYFRFIDSLESAWKTSEKAMKIARFPEAKDSHLVTIIHLKGSHVHYSHYGDVWAFCGKESSTNRSIGGKILTS